MKKLIYISNARMPTEKAHGYQIMKMAEGFCKLGLQVELVLPKRQNPVKDDIFSFYGLNGLEGNLKIKKLPCLDLIQQDKYLGHFAFLLEVFTYSISLFFYVLFKKADVFYTRDKVFLPLTLFKKNFVLEAHSFPRRYSFYRLYIKRLKGVVVLTKRLKEMFAEKGVIEDKIFVSPDGVDLATFALEMGKEQARARHNLPLAQKIIGYFGRFRTMGEEKGIGEVLQALVFLPKEVIFLAVGGSKEDVAFYQRKAEVLKVESRVILKQRVDRPTLAQYQKACDLLLMPFPNTQHYAYYMSPLKMFEFMASQRPILTSDLPSVREVLNEGNAFFVKADNIDALSKGIEFALSNEDLAEARVEQAFKDVQQYSWQKRAEKIIKFLI